MAAKLIFVDGLNKDRQVEECHMDLQSLNSVYIASGRFIEVISEVNVGPVNESMIHEMNQLCYLLK